MQTTNPRLDEFFYTPVLHLKYNFENMRKMQYSNTYLFNGSVVVEHDLLKLS